MTENPCVGITEEYFMDRNKVYMRRISNVADVWFEPSLTSPNYTGTFADGQKISFDPNTVDWENLERTCKNWSQRILLRQFAAQLDRDLTKRHADNLKRDSNFGAC